MIIVSFLKVVYPLKYPSNACYLDNDLGVLPVRPVYRCLTGIEHLNTSQISKHS